MLLTRVAAEAADIARVVLESVVEAATVIFVANHAIAQLRPVCLRFFVIPRHGMFINDIKS